VNSFRLGHYGAGCESRRWAAVLSGVTLCYIPFTLCAQEAGGTVVVCPGTYRRQALVLKPVRLT